MGLIFLFSNSRKEFSLIRENADRSSAKSGGTNEGASAAAGGKSSSEDPELNPMLQRSVLAPLLISLGLMFFQQWSGVNAVIFYTVSIFDAADSAIEKNLATIIVGITQFLATFGKDVVSSVTVTDLYSVSCNLRLSLLCIHSCL